MPGTVNTANASDGEPFRIFRVHLTDRVEIGPAGVDLMKRGQDVSGTITI